MAETMTARQKQVERINQLRAKLERAQNRLTSADRKARNGQLVVFGVYVEEVFKKASEEGRKRIEDSIKAHLTGRNLARALEGIARLKEEAGIPVPNEEHSATSSDSEDEGTSPFR